MVLLLLVLISFEAFRGRTLRRVAVRIVILAHDIKNLQPSLRATLAEPQPANRTLALVEGSLVG
ncbi:MAG: hypothetical protein DME22_14250 [Verrucomicrobia bacterium]|nr:MAG: hypothetical protein DME22_14250 [Verrucomicrobiota bacterium]PYJ95890.1 MAG: hypothetical protein DME23_22355 [Verrucomicrobiota bacterium]